MLGLLLIIATGKYESPWDAKTLKWRESDWGKRGINRAWVVVKPFTASQHSGERLELDLAVGDTVWILNMEDGRNGEWALGEKTVVGDTAGVAGASLRTARGYFPFAHVIEELASPSLKLVQQRSDLSSWRHWPGSAVAKQLVQLVLLILQHNPESVTVTPVQAERCGCLEVPRLDSATKIGLACPALPPPMRHHPTTGALSVDFPAECASTAGKVCEMSHTSTDGVKQMLSYLILFCPPGFIRTCRWVLQGYRYMLLCESFSHDDDV